MNHLRARTEQKLRFAQLHLTELAAMPVGRGHDFEIAHHEAFLAQLLGAYHAFLGELNAILGCGLDEAGISLGNLRAPLKARGRSSAVLRTLYELESDEAGWFHHVQELRHTSMHVTGIPLTFYVGGTDDGKVALKHPRTKKELPDDVAISFSGWLAAMHDLIDRLREEACAEGERRSGRS